MHKFKNYIFDMDGTLINSSEEVLKCFKQAFKEAKYEIDTAKLTSDVIGPPLRQIIDLIAPDLVDEEKINEIISNFRRIYDYSEDDVSVMYSGIYDLLVNLKKLNYKLFIATFKPNIPTLRLIKKFGLESFFEDIYTIDKFGTKITKEEMITDILKSHNLKREETVMIGDAKSDMIAAKGAGVIGIGVLWGYGSDKEPIKQNSDLVV